MASVTESTVTESIVIDAPAAEVYDLVSDVERMGEWSPEATGALRRTAHSPVRTGDRFVGTNRRGPLIWATVCTVRQAEPGRWFAFDVDVGPFPVSQWSFTLEPAGAATRVTESWTDRRSGIRGLAMKAVGKVIIPRDRAEHNRANMRTTLQRLKETAERGD